MPATSAKNMLLTPAFQDLGLGTQLQQQVEDQETERKKKLAQLTELDQLGGASLALLGKASGYGG